MMKWQEMEQSYVYTKQNKIWQTVLHLILIANHVFDYRLEKLLTVLQQ